MSYNSAVIKELQVYETIEMIWHAAETMLFTRSPVLPGLLSWVQSHFYPHLEDSFKSLCNEAADSDNPASYKVHEHVEYWPSIFAYVVRGMTKQARQLLALHPQADATANPSENVFEIVKGLLKRMPMIKANVEETDFQSQYSAWKAEVAAASSRNDIFVNRPSQLRTIFSILSGDASTLCQFSNNWAILLVSLILYTHPTHKPHDVRAVLQNLPTLISARKDSEYSQSHIMEFLPTIGGLNETVDALVRAIFEIETAMILHGVLDYGNPWFVAHFLDLFSLCDPTPFERMGTESDACTYHEFAFLEYVTSLSTNRLPLRLLADYLGCCPQFGREHLVHLIARQPIYTEREACKMLSLCHTFKLSQSVASNSIIQAVVSQRARTGRTASALAWATGSQARQLADSLLNTVFLPLTKLDTSLLQHLKLSNANLTSAKKSASESQTSIGAHKLKIDLIVEAIASSSRTSEAAVQCLKLYAATLQAYTEGDLQETVVLLGRSLGSEIAPKRFWLQILVDCVALLEQIHASRSAPVFSSSEIYDLMHCLEEIDHFEANSPNSELASNVRLTLSHQLSEAILSGQ